MAAYLGPGRVHQVRSKSSMARWRSESDILVSLATLDPRVKDRYPETLPPVWRSGSAGDL